MLQALDKRHASVFHLDRLDDYGVDVGLRTQVHDEQDAEGRNELLGNVVPVDLV